MGTVPLVSWHGVRVCPSLSVHTVACRLAAAGRLHMSALTATSLMWRNAFVEGVETLGHDVEGYPGPIPCCPEGGHDRALARWCCARFIPSDTHVVKPLGVPASSAHTVFAVRCIFDKNNIYIYSKDEKLHVSPSYYHRKCNNKVFDLRPSSTFKLFVGFGSRVARTTPSTCGLICSAEMYHPRLDKIGVLTTFSVAGRAWFMSSRSMRLKAPPGIFLLFPSAEANSCTLYP